MDLEREKGIRLARKTQAGPSTPVGMQPYQATRGRASCPNSSWMYLLTTFERAPHYYCQYTVRIYRRPFCMFASMSWSETKVLGWPEDTGWPTHSCGNAAITG
jgi:hypothetical protein